MVQPIGNVPAYEPEGGPWDLLKPRSENPAEPKAGTRESSRPPAGPAPAAPRTRPDEDLVAFLAASLGTTNETRSSPGNPADPLPAEVVDRAARTKGEPAAASAPSPLPPPLVVRAAIPCLDSDALEDRERAPAPPGEANLAAPSVPPASPEPLVPQTSLRGQSSRPWRWLGVAALGAAAVGMGWAAIRTGRTTVPPTIEPVAELVAPEPLPARSQAVTVPSQGLQPATSVASAGDAPPSEDQGLTTRVTLTVFPPEAMITRPGAVPRTSPVVYELGDGEKLVLDLSCWGYVSRTIVLDGSASKVSVTLTKAERGAAARAAKAATGVPRGASSKPPVPTRRFDPLP